MALSRSSLRISVVIPVFNRATHVLDAIRSVLAQTFPACEILVVDDGSTDGSAEAVAAAFGAKVRLLRQANLGPSAARNTAIHAASGDWIAFLDSDDCWLPQKLEEQSQVIEQYQKIARVCFCDNFFSGDQALRRSVFAMTNFSPAESHGVLDDAGLLIAEEREPFYTSSIVIARDLLLQVGGFDQAVTLREDSDLFFRLSLRTRFCYTSTPLVMIDRDPMRPHGLCELYASRNKRKNQSLERVYSKWFSMPAVQGTRYGLPVRHLLRRTYWNSFADYFRACNLRAAFNRLRWLKQVEGGLLPFLRFFVAKLWHGLRRRMP